MTEGYVNIPLKKITLEDTNKKIRTFGWVENSRIQKTSTFLTLYAEYKQMKCIYVKSAEEVQILFDELNLKNENKYETLKEANENLNNSKKNEFESKENEKPTTLSKFEEELKKNENPEELLEKLKLLDDPEKTKTMKKKELRYLNKLKNLRDQPNDKNISKKTEMHERGSFTFSSSLEIFGEVKENIFKDKDGFEFEFHIHKINILGIAPSYPITSKSDAFSKLENGHLYLRLPERRLYLKARSLLMKLIREYYHETDHTEIIPPTLVQNQVEGGSTLFKLDYYGKSAYLTQSSQLYLETVVPVSMKAYCTTQSYRAEQSNTRRHLSEYMHVEAELADIKFDDLMDSIENLIHYVLPKFNKILKNDILEVYPDFIFDEWPKFLRMTYKDAIQFLRDEEYLTEEGKLFEVGDDIPDAAERFILSKKKVPIFLTNFLIEHKPFYMLKSKIHEGTTESVDLLYPGVGEIVGGSMRTTSFDTLIGGLKRENIPIEPYYWYSDLLRFGPCSHGGYGLGFERLLMAIMKYDSINQACLYPRFVGRCKP